MYLTHPLFISCNHYLSFTLYPFSLPLSFFLTLESHFVLP